MRRCSPPHPRPLPSEDERPALLSVKRGDAELLRIAAQVAADVTERRAKGLYSLGKELPRRSARLRQLAQCLADQLGGKQ